MYDASVLLMLLSFFNLLCLSVSAESILYDNRVVTIGNMNIIHNSLFSNLHNEFGPGGAFYIVGSTQITSLENSLFINCTSASSGGGFAVENGIFTIKRTCGMFCMSGPTHQGQFAKFYTHQTSTSLNHDISVHQCGFSDGRLGQDAIICYSLYNSLLSNYNSTLNQISRWGDTIQVSGCKNTTIRFMNCANNTNHGSIFCFLFDAVSSTVEHSNFIGNYQHVTNHHAIVWSNGGSFPSAVTDIHYCVFFENKGADYVFRASSQEYLLTVSNCYVSLEPGQMLHDPLITTRDLKLGLHDPVYMSTLQLQLGSTQCQVGGLRFPSEMFTVSSKSHQLFHFSIPLMMFTVQ